MKGGAFLLVLAMAAPLLAGCAGDAPAASPTAVGPGALEAGRFYAFHHGGGSLAFALAESGSGEVVLYGADDSRIGRIGVGDDQASGRFVLDRVPAGDLVLHVVAVNGTLDIRSGGSQVKAFQELPRHIERHLLVQAPVGPLAVLGLSGADPQPVDETLDFTLLRAPADLRILVQGAFQDLEIRLAGRAGTILQVDATSGPVQFLGPFAFGELQGESYGENVRDGAITAEVRASHFEGFLLLEAESFSRAAPPAGGEPTDDVPRFTFGVLPDQPVSFQVRSGAEHVYLFQEGAEPEDLCGGAADEAEDAGQAEACEGPKALVALFGPHDERVATVEVPFNRTVAVPVHEAGEWVAVLLSGEATLGADLVPADFELHPLDVRMATAPASSAGSRNGEYAQATAEMAGDGVVFRIRGYEETPGAFVGPQGSSFPGGCGPSTLAAVQDGETIGLWGFDRSFTMDANALLDGSPVTLVHDDFGPDCPRMALLVEGYVR